MSDKPRPWPNQAMHARDETAITLAHALRVLETLLDESHQLTQTNTKFRIAVAMNDVQKALRILESVGACTRP